MKAIAFTLFILLVFSATIVAILAGMNNKVVNLQDKLNCIQDTVRATKEKIYSNISSYMGDYQVDATKDSLFIWDGSRFVGAVKLTYDADPLSTLILEDNR